MDAVDPSAPAGSVVRRVVPGPACLRRSRGILFPVPVILATLAIVLLVGCGNGEGEGRARPELSVTGAWARPMALMGEETGVNSAAYLRVRNRGTVPDTLEGAETPVARVVEVHQTTMEDGIMRMRPVDFVVVPAGGEVALEPGGLHMMLVGLNRSLAVGDTIPMTLRFRRSPDLELAVPVMAMGGG